MINKAMQKYVTRWIIYAQSILIFHKYMYMYVHDTSLWQLNVIKP